MSIFDKLLWNNAIIRNNMQKLLWKYCTVTTTIIAIEMRKFKLCGTVVPCIMFPILYTAPGEHTNDTNSHISVSSRVFVIREADVQQILLHGVLHHSTTFAHIILH